MAKREVIDIPGVAHQAPIPSGVKIGNMVFSSAISGRDAKTNELPADPDQQAKLLFQNLRTFMAQAGGNPDNIGHVTLYIKDERQRDIVNRYWIEMFPNEKDRPARHAVSADLRGGMLFQLEIIAVL